MSRPQGNPLFVSPTGASSTRPAAPAVASAALAPAPRVSVVPITSLIAPAAPPRSRRRPAPPPPRVPGAPHQVREYTDFDTDEIEELQEELKNFAGSGEDMQLLKGRLEQEWIGLKETVIEELDEAMTCPTCEERVSFFF
jgi:hypothetical protein